jgi:hypothetical protein
MKALRVGQAVPAVAVSASEPRTLTAVRPNAAGLVNLEIIPAIPNPGCGSVKYIKDMGNVITDVAQTYSTYDYVREYFQYSQGQSSTLGVGISSTGSNGTWSLDGTQSSSTTSSGTQDYVWIFGQQNDRWQTEFRWGKFSQECTNQIGQTYYNYYLLPRYWGGGGPYTTKVGGVPSTPYCVPELSSETYTKNNSTATTFGIGFSLVGFNASAQTGYSTAAEVQFHFQRKGYLCGRNQDPGGAPGFMNATG